MKKGLLILFFLATSICFSQSQMHKSVTNNFIQNFNNNDFEKIIQSFSEKMQNARPKSYFNNFFNRVKNDSGSILNLDLIKYDETTRKKSRGEYNAQTENGSVTIKISVNEQGQIIGLSIFKNKIYI